MSLNDSVVIIAEVSKPALEPPVIVISDESDCEDSQPSIGKNTDNKKRPCEVEIIESVVPSKRSRQDFSAIQNSRLNSLKTGGNLTTAYECDDSSKNSRVVKRANDSADLEITVKNNASRGDVFVIDKKGSKAVSKFSKKGKPLQSIGNNSYVASNQNLSRSCKVNGKPKQFVNPRNPVSASSTEIDSFTQPSSSNTSRNQYSNFQVKPPSPLSLINCGVIPLTTQYNNNNRSSNSKSIEFAQSTSGESNKPCKRNDLTYRESSCDVDVIPIYKLRPIAIDGSNVAMSHGKNVLFSCRGIEICVDYFIKRGHEVVKAFVPQYRRRQSSNVADQNILEKLATGNQFVVFTPSRKIGGKDVVCYDDRFILEYAASTGAVIVSNDNYRDLMREKPEWIQVVRDRLLMYTFVDNMFLVPEDPMGRGGPSLSEFLRF